MISRMSTLPSESDDFNDLNGFNGFNAEKHKIIDVPPFCTINRPNLYGDGRASEKIVSRLKG